MKTITIFCFLFFSVIGITAQKGLTFEELSFDQALEKAKESKKMLFIDCYTVWCGPCKMMAKEEFTKDEAKLYFEPRFISVKYDMEKGEGVRLAKRFNVTSFPTFLIISPQGEEVHRVVGSSEMEEFIKKVDRGLNETTALTNLNRLYKSGKLENKYYQNYQIALSNAGRRDEAKELLTELWEKLSDDEKSKPEYWWIYDDPSISTLESPYFQFVEKNLPEFKKQGEAKIGKYMYEKYLPVMDSYIYGYAEDRKDYECIEIDRFMDKIRAWNIAEEEKMLALCRLGKARCEKKVSDIIATMKAVEPLLSANEYSRLISPMSIVAKQGTKEQLMEGVNVLEKAKSTSTGKQKELLTTYISMYKKQTVVGISFDDVSFQEALNMAKKENKLVFIDAYTSWCGPCKRMAQEVFTNEKVGNFFNTRFINLKIDMEKGEGIELAQKYGVKAYPTYLLIRPDGILQHLAMGYKDADEFIAIIAQGTDAASSVNVQKIKYDAGNRTKKFLTSYARLLFKKGDSQAYKVSKELLQYLNKQEKFSPEYWYFYDQSLAVKEFEPEFRFVINNIDKYYETVGRAKVDSTLSMIYRLKALYSIDHKEYRLTNEKIALMQAEIERLDFPDRHVLLGFMKLAKVALTNDKNLFIKTGEEEVISRLSAETFPYMDLTEFVLNEANDAQQKRWKAIGDKLLLQLEQDPKRNYLQSFIKNIFPEKK